MQGVWACVHMTPNHPRYGLMLSAVPQVLRIVVEESRPDGAARHVTSTWHDHQ